MKLKCKPEDFRVEERSSFAIGGGAFAVYELTKRSIGTPEAIDAIAGRWKLRRERVSFGGMKDRHAETTQHVTVHHGPKRGLKQNNIELRYLGQSQRHFAPADIDANRFTIVLRDMSDSAVERAVTALREAETYGFPNYFDDQRFGSVGESGEFIAKSWCLGDYERALWLTIADANEHDRPDDRQRKKALRDNWGNWPKAASLVAKSPVAPLVAYLADRPGDFRGAFSRVRPDMRDLYLAAFQSFIWNRMLSLLIVDLVAADKVVEVKFDHDTLVFQRELTPGQRQDFKDLLLPLPSARARLDSERDAGLADRVLKGIGMELKQLKTKAPRDVYFSRGNRPAFIFPEGVAHEVRGDDMHPGRRSLTLRLDLPRGAYATILVKRITNVAAEMETKTVTAGASEKGAPGRGG